jgi:hypothetical protein
MATELEVIAAIRVRAEKSSLRRLAAEVGVSYTYLTDIVAGRRRVSAYMASKFGFTRIVSTVITFERTGVGKPLTPSERTVTHTVTHGTGQGVIGRAGGPK